MFISGLGSCSYIQPPFFKIKLRAAASHSIKMIIKIYKTAVNKAVDGRLLNETLCYFLLSNSQLCFNIFILQQQFSNSYQPWKMSSCRALIFMFISKETLFLNAFFLSDITRFKMYLILKYEMRGGGVQSIFLAHLI